MADPLSLNAPVSVDLRVGLGMPAATVAPEGPASSPIVVADLPETPRPRVTQAPSGRDVLPAPNSAPRRTVRTGAPQAEATPPAASYRTNDITRAEADRAVAESQRVLLQRSGVTFGRPQHTFEPSLVFRDQLGETHVRLQRHYRGLPVFGEQVITHMDRTGNIRHVTNAETPPNLNIDITPSVAAEQANAVALQAFGATPPQTQTNPRLVVTRDDNGQYRLAWHVILSSLPGDGDEPRRMHYFIDAKSNQLIYDFNEIHGFIPDFIRERINAATPNATPERRLPLANPRGAIPRANAEPAPAPVPSEPAPAPVPSPTASETTPPAPAPAEPAPTPAEPPPPPPPFTPAHGLGTSVYSGNVPLATSRRTADGLFVLRDPTRRDTETRDANGAGNNGAFGPDGFPVSARPITDTDNAWGTPGDDVRNRTAVNAHYYGVRYDDFLRDMFGRNGIDGSGLMGRSVVHVGRNMVNAFYYNSVMWFGDGDGRNAGPLVDKDVAGHEPTHGLISNTSGLVYRGESGAMNEAVADILGSAVFSWYLRNNHLPPEQRDQGIASDWLVGEDCWTPGTQGDALRYMNDPPRDRQGTSEFYSRDNYSTRYRGWGDNGGVHINSGIANNWFYLLAAGGTNRTSQQTIAQGIGMEKAARIFYRANATYFTPFTNFVQAREGTIRAATDLYGADSVEARTVAAAWSAVGVEPPPPPPPAAPPAPPAPPAPAPPAEPTPPAPPAEPAPAPAPTSLRRRA